MAILEENAVVLGASMSGLLAARALADHFRTVTVIERDELPSDPINRRGVPQGRHGHALLARGSQILEEFFPGILNELAAGGAPVWDGEDMSWFYVSYSGHLMPRTGLAGVDTSMIVMYQASRPFLEYHVRRRLRALGNVTILDRHDVAELTASEDNSRITGVRVTDRDGDSELALTADLVVDAMGRAGHTPAFLETLGYGRPAEEHVVVHTTYVSQLLRIPPGTLPEKFVLISPEPGRLTGLFFFAYEDDTWIFTTFGMAGNDPPRDLAGMLSFAADYAPAHALAAVRAGEPLGPVVQHKLPSSQWRRYDKMQRFPDGLVVCGDAMCSFNPIYGQGMTVAAMEAVALQRSLRGGLPGLAKRYFRSAAKAVGVAWGIAAGSDLAFPEIEGRRTASMRLTSRYVDWVLAACESDPVVFVTFFGVTGLVDPPARLFHPAFVFRVAAANRRRRRAGTPG